MAAEPELAPNLWDRQQGESLPAYEAFSAYLNAGPDRSLAKVAQALGKSRQLLARWSSRNHWQSRVLAFADAEDQKRQQELIRERATLRDVTLLSAKRLHQSALEALMNFRPTRKVMVGGELQTICVVRPHEIAKMLEVAFRLQRSVLGDLDDTTPTVIQVSIDGYPDEPDLPEPQGTA